jgi:hypothetical protein
MRFVAGAVFVLTTASSAAAQVPRQQRPSAVRDSTPADSIRRRTPRRMPVTAEALRTAYHDEQARELVLRARHVRLTQDSSLRAYDANVRQRLTARLGIGAKGIQRVMYRQESASRVQWDANVGARVELTGARVGIPVAPEQAEREALESSVIDGAMTPIPYLPGREPTMGGAAPIRGEVDDRDVVQPLAEGAEAYYTYASGDSMTWTLPNGRKVRLREIAVRPRSPKWNLSVGSYWFDVETGTLVRAGYRLAVPLTVWTAIDEETREDGTHVNPIAKTAAKALVSPLRFEITGITVEYGLFDGRYWLPRARSLEGTQQVSFAHMSVLIEQSFSYSTINGPSTVPAIVLNQPPTVRPEPPDSLTGDALRKWRDSVTKVRVAARKAFVDSLRKAPCDSTGHRVAARDRAGVSVAVSYPCDVQSLVKSTDFDKPLYDDNESLFGAAQRDALLSDALPFGAQALIRLSELPRPNFEYGLSLTRYNRIEGFSTGLSVEQQLGAGYSARLTGRVGFADHEPNAELELTRANANRSITLAGYNRLVSVNDWGNPLSFGASMSALLFGRDEGFYSRASGAELRGTNQRTQLDWRLFGEQQRTANWRATYSVGGDFGPNVVSATGAWFGAGLRWTDMHGIDPRGFRVGSDVRVEGATGDSSYGRAAFDVTLSNGFPGRLTGALTLSAGASAGQLPPQRRWFLGGTQTIRGQSPDTAYSGNAFWMSRLETGVDLSAFRLLAFGDLGWAGDRRDISNLIRPMSGVGIGYSAFDGLLRFDVARGLYPRKQTRYAAYLQTRF